VGELSLYIDEATGRTTGCRRDLFLLATAFRPVLGPIQPPTQCVPGSRSLRIMRLYYEADHSPPSSPEVKNAWSYISNPPYVFMTWYLVKHRDKFTYIF